MDLRWTNHLILSGEGSERERERAGGGEREGEEEGIHLNNWSNDLSKIWIHENFESIWMTIWSK